MLLQELFGVFACILSSRLYEAFFEPCGHFQRHFKLHWEELVPKLANDGKDGNVEREVLFFGYDPLTYCLACTQ
jgi:hypothetical protein